MIIKKSVNLTFILFQTKVLINSCKEMLFSEEGNEKLENQVNEELISQILVNNKEINSVESKTNRSQAEMLL